MHSGYSGPVRLSRYTAMSRHTWCEPKPAGNGVTGSDRLQPHRQAWCRIAGCLLGRILSYITRSRITVLFQGSLMFSTTTRHGGPQFLRRNVRGVLCCDLGFSIRVHRSGATLLRLGRWGQTLDEQSQATRKESRTSTATWN